MLANKFDLIWFEVYVGQIMYCSTCSEISAFTTSCYEVTGPHFPLLHYQSIPKDILQSTGFCILHFRYCYYFYKNLLCVCRCRCRMIDRCLGDAMTLVDSASSHAWLARHCDVRSSVGRYYDTIEVSRYSF